MAMFDYGAPQPYAVSDLLKNNPLDIGAMWGQTQPNSPQRFGLSPYSPGIGNPTLPTAGVGGWKDFLLGSEDVNGIKTGGAAMPLIAGAGALMNGFLGMKQYGLGKQGFDESKRQFGLNYDAQRQMTNSQLEDRQRARVASNPGAYQSPSEYMSQYGVR